MVLIRPEFDYHGCTNLWMFSALLEAAGRTMLFSYESRVPNGHGASIQDSPVLLGLSYSSHAVSRCWPVVCDRYDETWGKAEYLIEKLTLARRLHISER